MDKAKVKRLKQLLNEYILDFKVNLDTPISFVYRNISEEYHNLKVKSQKGTEDKNGE